jgi:PEP-CTERM motif
MKLANLFKRCTPAVLLVFASLTASATTCASISGQTLNTLVSDGGCTMGDLTFSNFFFNYTSGVNTGAPNGVVSPTDPNPSTNVTLMFAEIANGVTEDPWGTVGSSSAPLYEVITNYATGSDSVNEYQNEHYFVSYEVTDSITGAAIDQVDDNVTGSAINGAQAALTNKSVCIGGVFAQSGGIPSSSCTQGLRNTYQAVDLGGGGTTLSGSPASGADSTSDFPGANAPFLQGPGTTGSNNIGVYDQADMNGGNSSVIANSSVTSVENDFEEQLPPGGTPEPSTIILLGGALVGLGVIRRKKLA